MRKLTSLLMLLSLFVGTAWSETIAEPTTGKFYRLQANNKYLTIDSYGANSSTGTKGTVPMLEKEDGNRDQVWELEAVDADNNQYRFLSKSGYYLTCRHWNCDATAADGSTITINAVDGGYQLSWTNTYKGNATTYFKVEAPNGDANSLHPYCDAAVGAAATWTFIEVPATETFAEPVDVTYNYYVDSEFLCGLVVPQEVGSAVAAPQYDYVNITTAPTGTVSSTNNTFRVDCTLETLPFTVTDDIDNPVWQVVEMHRNGTRRFWEYNASSNGKIDVVDYQANMYDVVADNKLWCFVGNAVAGFRIYNKAVGTGSTLNATSGNPTIGTTVGDNDVWHLAKSSASTDVNVACFTQDASSYMNQQGGKIAYWSSADNGSTCYFFQPKDIALPAASTVNARITNVASVTNIPEGAIGVIDVNSDAVNQFQAKYAALSAEGATPTVDELIALGQSAKAALATATPVTAGYYFIYGTGTGNNASWRLTYNGQECHALPLEAGEQLGAKHVWYFDPVEDGFKLKACNLDKYLVLNAAPAVSEITSDFQNGHKFVFASDGAGRYTIKNGDGNVLRTEQAGDVNYWNGENYETWYLVPAEKLSVTVSDAAGYATIHLPFDVKLPEDGSVKAYAATSVGTSAITLTLKEDIPANQGAILKGAGTHELSIVNAGEATSDWNGNNLEGTNVDTPIQGQAYVLSMQNGLVGMYRTALNLNSDGTAATDGSGTHFLNNANKAYLSKVGESRFLLFDFGTETGIGNIEGTEDAATGKAAIYDLSGRRVSNAQKGIYIMNGKKVVK